MAHPLDDTQETLTVTAPVEGVVHVRLDRRPKLNAIDESLLDELTGVVDSLAQDRMTRALLLSGAGGRAFSVGADIRHRLGDLDADTAFALSRLGQRTFDDVARFPGPVLACIDGYCLGGGMELAACADLRIASPASTFGQPEREHGLIPGWGGTQRLPRIIGPHRAKQVIFTGETYDAETMHQYGFLTELADAPVETGRAYAEQVTDSVTAACRHAKQAIQQGHRDGGFAYESLAFAHLAARLEDDTHE